MRADERGLKMIVEHGVYRAKLNQDVDLVYFSRLKAFGLHYSEKPITYNSVPWKHKQPIVEDVIQCKHPKKWNKHSKEVQIIKEFLENYEKENKIRSDEEDEREILRAIKEIASDIDKVRTEILNKKKEIKKSDPFHITCDDCECYGCFKTNECGECR